MNTSATIIASIDGNFIGIKQYNPCTFSFIDSIAMPFGVPNFIEYTNDNSRIYGVLPGTQNNNFIVALKINPLNIEHLVPCEGYRISKSYDDTLLFVYGDWFLTLQIFNSSDLTLLNEQELGRIGLMISANEDKYMYGLKIDEHYTGVFKYNTSSFIIEEENQISEFAEQPGDISITPDNRFIFFTTTVGGGFPVGKFYAYDTISEQLIFVEQCPAYASICASPDGKYVYITDPAGYLLEVNPTGKLFRYNANSNLIEEFIDWVPYNLTNGAYDGRLPTEHIEISSDNKYLFISTSTGRTKGGESIDIIKINIRNKKIINFLSIPLDYRGYKTESIHNFKLIEN